VAELVFLNLNQVPGLQTAPVAGRGVIEVHTRWPPTIAAQLSTWLRVSGATTAVASWCGHQTASGPLSPTEYVPDVVLINISRCLRIPMPASATTGLHR
jgi:hypothetical protein